MGFRGSRVQIPPSRPPKGQASHRVPVWGFFFTTSLASRKRCGLHALNEEIRVEGAGPKPPPRSEDTESLQVGVVRHAHCDCNRHGPSPRGARCAETEVVT